MTCIYEVAGIGFSITMPEACPLWKQLHNYEPFRVSEAGELAFEARYCASLDVPCTSKVDLPAPKNKREPKVELFAAKDGEILFEMSQDWLSPLAGRMLLSEDRRLASFDTLDKYVVNNSVMLAYAISTAKSGTLEMHASVVASEGLAYMFLGPSGTGKSTHSRLWLENIPGSTLLNDDNPIVRIVNPDNPTPETGTVPDAENGNKCRQEIVVYGSPWSGKTACYKNRAFKLGAVVNLHQAKQNSIKKVSVPEAYATIFSSCSGLKFDSCFMDTLHETLAAIASAVPCYELYCLPDRDAALLCHGTITPDDEN